MGKGELVRAKRGSGYLLRKVSGSERDWSVRSADPGGSVKLKNNRGTDLLKRTYSKRPA